MPSKRKKWGKTGLRGREKRKRKVKVESAVSLLSSKPFEIFVSTYAQTLEDYNLHLEQKIAKCSIYERRLGHKIFSLPEQFLGRQAGLVPFLPIAILYFENLQLYRLRLGMTGSVALSCRQNNQHEYYLRAVVSPGWTLRYERKTNHCERPFAFPSSMRVHVSFTPNVK